MNFIRQLFDFLLYPIRLIFSAPMTLLSAPRRLLGMSLPARVAVLVAIFCVLASIFSSIVLLVSPQRPDLSTIYRPWNITGIVLLVIIIPFIVYFALRYWMEGEVSQFPDIDYAWKEGFAAIQQHGLDLQQTPVFLILGASDDLQAKSLLDASRLSLRVRDTPAGPAALHWYADPSGIYLVCTEACRLSKLAAKLADPHAPALAVSPKGRGSDPPRGTIVPGGVSAVRESRTFSASSPKVGATSWNAPANLSGTMVPSADGSEGARAVVSGSVTLTPADSALQAARLEYVITLLKRARQPHCPLNGVLTVLPFSLIQRSLPEAVEVQRAVKEDLATLRKATKLRFPVTALVGGMESESGFCELIRRLGPDRAKMQRFGKGFNIWVPPLGEQIEAVARHSCGAFEDFVYALFRETDGFNQAGNTKLYSLLCNIRSNLHQRLTNLLVAAYAYEAPLNSVNREPPLFGGCYFAATGETDDRQAFVKSVFEKLVEQENELAWTEEAMQENQRYRKYASFSLVLSGFLIIGLVAVVVCWLWFSPTG